MMDADLILEVNNLGAFDSFADLWEQYPEGGNEGDYVLVGPEGSSTKYHWNKYDRAWDDGEHEVGGSQSSGSGSAGGGGTETPSRKNVTIDGDLTVTNNTVVGGDLRVNGKIYASEIAQPYCGLFPSIDALRAAHPEPWVGQWAIVGDTVPGEIWRCETSGQWSDTGETGGVDSLDWQAISDLQAAMEGVVHKGGEETITGAKTFTSRPDFDNAIHISNGVSFFEDNIHMCGNMISELCSPTEDSDAANKAYVDGAIGGIRQEEDEAIPLSWVEALD